MEASLCLLHRKQQCRGISYVGSSTISLSGMIGKLWGCHIFGHDDVLKIASKCASGMKSSTIIAFGMKVSCMSAISSEIASWCASRKIVSFELPIPRALRLAACKLFPTPNRIFVAFYGHEDLIGRFQRCLENRSQGERIN